jgi:hypothetical protein
MGLFKRKSTDEVIDLREPEAAAPPKPVWGSPVPCPACAGRGFLDHIDPFRELMYLHCTVCGEKYELHKSAFADDPAAEVPEPFESFTSYTP